MNFRAPTPNAPVLLFGNVVTALDRTTGDTLWEYGVDRENIRRFALDNERLFVLDAEGILHCIHAQTGQLFGKVDLDTPAASNLLLDQGQLFVAGSGAVIAVDLQGRILWKKSIHSSSAFSLMGIGVPGGNVVQPDYSRG